MTITYQKNVSNTSFMGFAKLLFIWKGSIYKLVFRELIMYGTAYTLISVCYRYVMSDIQKRQFESVALYCDQTSELLPMSFVLGFYVTFVVSRWWNQFLNLPWPDRIAHTVLMYVSGSDDRGRIIRRTLMRYVNLTTIILFQTISGSAKKRFPTMSHIVDAGLMTSEEKKLYDSIAISVNKHWVPLTWFINLTNLAVREGRVLTGEPIKQLLDEINSLRNKTGHLWGHDWVTVPLVYTQVVTLLTHLFFLTCLIGRQFLDPAQGYPGHRVDLYFPVYTFLQFFFFLGWLKVAEQLINPFGEDDDDFEINWFLDRNIQVCYAIVDDSYGKLAKLEKDPHWGQSSIQIPYTEASRIHKIPNYKGSTMGIEALPKEQTVIHYDTRLEGQQRTNQYYNFQYFLSRYCCGCCQPGAPPINPPLGKSYNRTEPVNFDQCDSRRKPSTYSLFGDGYNNIVNRSCRQDSLIPISSQGGNDVVITNLPGNNLKSNRKLSFTNDPSSSQPESEGLIPPNSNYAHRHKPSSEAAQVLSSVCEMDQEDSRPSSAESVKIALAFLDEDLRDIVSEK